VFRPLLRKRQAIPVQNNESGPATASSTTEGSIQAIEQIGNWVRFADTKATILAAGLGVVLTMLVTNATTFIKALTKGCEPAFIVGGLAGVTILALLWTLFWLIRAIAPHGKVPYSELNRFAWPSLAGTTIDQLLTHVSQADMDTDAWQQVLDLSRIAKRKFDACVKVTYGFAFLVIASLSCAITAAAFTT
jgi:hypothetical protein